jgi:hypothetical protein
MYSDRLKYRCREFVKALSSIGLMCVMFQHVALAQYAFDPTHDDEQGDGIRYFGSVKDGAGAAIKDATILITNKSASFVFVTDSLGRFRGHLPADALASKVSIKCFKAETVSTRVSKRAGAGDGKRFVQVDCVLPASATASTGG